MEKKTLLAVILSVLVIIGYQVYVSKNYPVAGKNGTVSTVAVNKELTSRAEEKEFLTSSVEAEIQNVPETVITKQTNRYTVTLSSIGGCIKEVRLKDYVAAASDKGFDLINITDPKNGIFNMEGFGSKKLSRTNFAVEEKADEVVFAAIIDNKIELVKKYIFHKSSPLIELELYIKNISDKEINTYYIINTGSNMGIDDEIDKRYIQGIAEINGKLKRNGGGKDPISGNIGYAGLQSRYFSVIAKNHMPCDAVMIGRHADGTIYTTIKTNEFALLPNSMTSNKLSLFLGPTDKKILGEYELSSAANFGLLTGIGDMLLGGLNLFYKIFKNWGIAIILLSLLVNLALFPLSRKSYESMKKMQHIQPHMDKLREEHKDNPHKLNKEMMELYKKYDVNPMGGCLPLLLQIPVFIALYQTLMKSLVLRGAKFLWVKDLSRPDAVMLPFSLPLIGHTINVLPILMAIAMMFQQRFSSIKGAAQSEQQKQQQQMMVIMPIVFLFIMYNFPSGLVIYWLVNTILTTFEQRAIMHG